MHYPMYNFSSPFTGTFNTEGHYIADLYLNRTGISALFGAIAHSNFRVNFTNPYVIGTNYTAVLAAMARNYNKISMIVDHATAITVCPPNISCTSNDNIFKSSGAAAIVLGSAQGSDLSIYLKAQSTYTKTEAPYAHAGIVAGKLTDSSIHMNVDINFAQLTSSGHHVNTGTVGLHAFRQCHNFPNYSFNAQTKFNHISIFSGGNFCSVGSTVGTIFGHLNSNTIDTANKINCKMNTSTIQASGTNSYIGACVRSC